MSASHDADARRRDADARSWDDVLAAVELDAARTARLVYGPLEQPEQAEPHLELPPLADMPPVPEHLRERIEQLRATIDGLRAELTETLRVCNVPPRHPLAIGTAAGVAVAAQARVAAPCFIDRLA